jgi:hypothetical protein
VTLQINIAPPDLPHAVHVLPHQLRVFAGQVDEVILTLDTVRPAGGRFAAEWEDRVEGMERLLDDLTGQYAHAAVSAVDASAGAVRAVGDFFFGVDRLPLKDSRGGPLYSYFHGLHSARNDIVLHMDSDMMFGGGSQSWVKEALALIGQRDEVLFAGPLPGPPRADGRLMQQPHACALPGQAHAFRFPTVSTRVFLLDRTRLLRHAGPLPLRPPLLLRSRVKARLKGNPSVAMPEQILSAALERHGLFRVDFLGRAPGMWSVHPPFRSAAFYRELPRLIARIEEGEVPDEQRGQYDIVDALFDFSDARARYARSPLRR